MTCTTPPVGSAPDRTQLRNSRRTSFRRYPADSPRAAARIVALSLLVDGRLRAAELEVLYGPGVERTLGVSRQQMHRVIDELCEDLLAEAHRLAERSCPVQVRALEDVMDEVTEPALRASVLAACIAIVAADNELSANERRLLRIAANRWSVPCAVMRSHGGGDPAARAAGDRE